jgi:hypothetical protein
MANIVISAIGLGLSATGFSITPPETPPPPPAHEVVVSQQAPEAPHDLDGRRTAGKVLMIGGITFAAIGLVAPPLE